MPTNNKKHIKDAKALDPTTSIVPNKKVNLKFVKNLQTALIEGAKSPTAFARDFLEVELYPKQAEIIDAMCDAPIANFSAGNRVGKTFVSGLMLLWKAFYRHHPSLRKMEKRTPYNVYKAVNTSLSFEQAKLAWSYALKFTQESKRFKPFFVDAVHSPFPTLKIKTKDEKGEWVISEVHARSLAKNGFYLLGLSINHLQVDECAYVPKYPVIEEEVLKMRLADTGGSLHRYSTPNGRNFFYTYYMEGLNPNNPLNVVSKTLTTWDNPFVSVSYLNEMKATLLEEYYRQNVMGDFVSLTDFFSTSAVAALYEGVDWTFPEPRERSGTYVMGADLGGKTDPTVVIVFRVDTTPVQLVAIDTTKGGGWEKGRKRVVHMFEQYAPAVTVIDATGGGAHVCEQIVNDDGLTNVIPFVFSATSKPVILTSLQDAVERRKFCFPYGHGTQELITQMGFYSPDDRYLSQDYVMALALVNKALDEYMRKVYMTTAVSEDLMFTSVLTNLDGVITNASNSGLGPGTLFAINSEGTYTLVDTIPDTLELEPPWDF